MNKYKYLFFDLDHTLWDFETNSVSTLKSTFDLCALNDLGINSFDDFNIIYHEINDKMWDKFRKGLLSREDLKWKRMWQTLIHYKISNTDLAKQMASLYLEILPQNNALFPHAIDLLDYCKSKNYELHLITNGFELTQTQKMKNSGIDIYFDKMITSEEAMSMKPQKEIFEYAMKTTGAIASNSLMIGDGLDVDVLGAQLVGMDQVYFNPKRTPHNGTPTYEISELKEMKNFV